MNTVYRPGSNTPLMPDQLCFEANALYSRRKRPFSICDFVGPNSRIAGTGHCDCNGDGEFELLPVHHPDVQNGQKRYMICRKCGCYSHL